MTSWKNRYDAAVGAIADIRRDAELRHVADQRRIDALARDIERWRAKARMLELAFLGVIKSLTEDDL